MNYGSRTISLQVGIWNSTGHPRPGELSTGTDFAAPEPHVPNKGRRRPPPGWEAPMRMRFVSGALPSLAAILLKKILEGSESVS